MNGYCKSMLQTINGIRNNITDVKKSTLAEMVKGFLKLNEYLQQGETSGQIFYVTVKWCRLFVEIQSSINPKRFKLLLQYEELAVTAITYIIRFLQYTNNEDENYHYDLLNILNILLHNLPPNILQKCDDFDTGTIASLWKPISCGVDYKTQRLALEVFTTFLKYINEHKWRQELQTIDCNYFSLIKEEIMFVIKETSRRSMFEKTCRELLNNCNMKEAKIFSFYCHFAIIDNKYGIFKRLDADTFWIDVNYSTQCISFDGRFRGESDIKYRNVEIKFKIKNIKLENGTLLVHYDDANIDGLSIATNEYKLQIFVSSREEIRIKENKFFNDFLKKIGIESAYSGNMDATVNSSGNEGAFDRLKNETSLNSQETDKSTNTATTNKRKSNLLDIFNASPPHPLIVENAIIISSNSNQSNYHCSPRVCSDVPSSPISTRGNRMKYNTKHPIGQLRSRRRRISGSNDDDDYVPYKRSKNNKKNKCNAMKKSTPRKSKSMDNTIQIENESSAINTGQQIRNNIVNVTRKLNHGKECDICDDGELEFDINRTKSKDNYTARVEHITNKISQNDSQLVQHAAQPLKSILKKRSLVTNENIDITNTSPYNVLNDISYDYPQLRLLDSPHSSIIVINSQPSPMPQTPNSTEMMNISDIYDNSSIDNDMESSEIRNHTDSEQYNDEQQDSQEYFIKLSQQIINDWSDEDESDFEGFAATNNDDSGFNKITKKRSHKNTLPQHGENHLDIKHFKENNNNIDKLPASDDNKNSKSVKKSNSKSKRKKKEPYILKWRTPKLNNNIESTIIKGLRSVKVTSHRCKESSLVIADDSLTSLQLNSSNVASNAIDTVELSDQKLSKEISIYKSKIENNLKLLRRSLATKTEVNRQEVFDITERIVNESIEQRNGIEKRLTNLERLKGQMELQCQLYIHRCKQIERFQKNAEQLLNVLNENANMSGITNECDELIKQFQEIEEDIRLETRWYTQGGDEK